MYHITQCNVCKKIVSISDGKKNKIKLLAGEWKTHLQFHMMQGGKAPIFTRWYPSEARLVP